MAISMQAFVSQFVGSMPRRGEGWVLCPVPTWQDLAGGSSWRGRFGDSGGGRRRALHDLISLLIVVRKYRKRGAGERAAEAGASAKSAGPSGDLDLGGREGETGPLGRRDGLPLPATERDTYSCLPEIKMHCIRKWRAAKLHTSAPRKIFSQVPW